MNQAEKMKNHLVEIYLDSYNSEPFVANMATDDAIDSHVRSWLKSRTGKTIDIQTQLKVADVSHPPCGRDSEATRLRVQLVR